MDNQTHLWALQLLQYFVVSKGYTQVKFIDTVTKKEDTDIWLANANVDEFNVIHISELPVKQAVLYQETYLLQYRSIVNVLKKKSKGLNICLDLEDISMSGDEMDFISLHPNGPVDDSIKKRFPEINTVIFNVADPNEECKKITKNVNQFALKHNDVKERRKRERSQRLSKTFRIVAPICIAIWAIINILALVTDYSLTTYCIVFGAYYKAFVVVLHEWYRLLTAGFVHSSIFHLLCNISALYSLSYFVEDKLGFGKTMAILLFSIVTGNLAVFIGNGNILALGLSGGLYGLMATMIIIYWKEGYFKYPGFIRSFISTIYINILINFLPNVSVYGHLGGFIGGAFLGYILYSSDKQLKTNLAICLVILLCGIGYLVQRSNNLDNYYILTDREVEAVFRDMHMDKIADRIETKTTEYYWGG